MRMENGNDIDGDNDNSNVNDEVNRKSNERCKPIYRL